jgi:hypothetical protein
MIIRINVIPVIFKSMRDGLIDISQSEIFFTGSLRRLYNFYFNPGGGLI